MNKIIILLVILILNTSITHAATATPEPTVSGGEKLIDEINNLREKVASKVAQLNLVEKRGIFMVVDEVSNNKITGTDLNNDNRIVDVDELTKFSSPTAKTFGISDISRNSKISVIGLYNKQSKRLLARYIETFNKPEFISGEVRDIDKANFTITIESINKKTTIVDIETITKTSIYSSKDGLEKLGFSKIPVGERVYVIGYTNIKDPQRLSATRVIVLPGLTKNPDIPQASSDSFEKTTISPTRKVTPIEEN